MPTCSFFGWKSMKTKLGTSLPDSKWIKDSSTWPSASCSAQVSTYSIKDNT